jgi:hypothetical protein
MFIKLLSLSKLKSNSVSVHVKEDCFYHFLLFKLRLTSVAFECGLKGNMHY